MNVFRPYAIFAMLIAAIMIVPTAVMTQGELGKTPKQVLPPKMIRQLQGEITEVVPSSELARLRGEVRANHEQLQGLLDLARTVDTNTQRISNLEMQAVEFKAHMAAQSGDPGHSAMVDMKLDMIVKVGTWILVSVGGLLVTAIGVLVKRWATRFKPPEWAREDRQQQEEYRHASVAKLDETLSTGKETLLAAQAAYAEANHVKQGLIDGRVKADIKAEKLQSQIDKLE